MGGEGNQTEDEKNKVIIFFILHVEGNYGFFWHLFQGSLLNGEESLCCSLRRAEHSAFNADSAPLQNRGHLVKQLKAKKEREKQKITKANVRRKRLVPESITHCH